MPSIPSLCPSREKIRALRGPHSRTHGLLFIHRRDRPVVCPVYQRGQAVWHANGLQVWAEPAEHVRAHEHRPGRLVPERKQDRAFLGCAGGRHFHSLVHFCHAGNGTHSLLNGHCTSSLARSLSPVLQAFLKQPLPENHSSPLSLLILIPLF